MRTKAPTDLATLFFGSYRRQVLGLLLLHPDESFHLREIARITATQPGTLRRELQQLTDTGVLMQERVGNLVRYKADPACPIYEELRGILKKTAGVADALREALSPLGDRVTAAFVYGSVAGGAERRASDLDVMVIGSVSYEEAVRALHPCQEQLRREINPSVYRTAEFRQKVAAKNSFLMRVLEQPKLFLVGGEDDVGKSRKSRQGKVT